MQYIGLNDNYCSVRLSINNFRKFRNAEIDELLHLYVETQGEPSKERDRLAMEIVRRYKK